MSRRVIRCEPFDEGSAARLRAQWPRPEDGVLFQLADFNPESFTIRVFDLSVSNSSTVVFSNTRAGSAVLTNNPFSWEWDSTGYNFSDEVLTSEVVYEGGHTYRWEYVGVRTDGTGNERLAFIARCNPSKYT